jgi:N-acetyl-S-(2-succino)cysteine monooxygenase
MPGISGLDAYISKWSCYYGELEVTGTVEQVVDQLELWFKEGAADGFNVIPPTFPEDLNLIVDEVIPELQRRGLFRTDYTGSTFREHLGLARPVHPNKVKVTT